MVHLNKCCWHSDGELGCQPSFGVTIRGGGRGNVALPSAFWAVFAPQFLLGIHLVAAPSSSPGAACSLTGARACPPLSAALYSSVCHSRDFTALGFAEPKGAAGSGNANCPSAIYTAAVGTCPAHPCSDKHLHICSIPDVAGKCHYPCCGTRGGHSPGLASCGQQTQKTANTPRWLKARNPSPSSLGLEAQHRPGSFYQEQKDPEAHCWCCHPNPHGFDSLECCLPKAACLQHLPGLAVQVLAVTVGLFRKHRAAWEAYRCLSHFYMLMTKLLGSTSEQGAAGTQLGLCTD